MVKAGNVWLRADVTTVDDARGKDKACLRPRIIANQRAVTARYSRHRIDGRIRHMPVNAFGYW